MNAAIVFFLMLAPLVTEIGVTAVGHVDGIHFVDSTVNVVTSNAAFENTTGKVQVVNGTAKLVKFNGEIVAKNSKIEVLKSDIRLYCDNSTIILLENAVEEAELHECKVYASANEFKDVTTKETPYWMNMMVVYSYNQSLYKEMVGNYWKNTEAEDRNGDGLSDRPICPEVKVYPDSTGTPFCEKVLVKPIANYKIHGYELPNDTPVEISAVMAPKDPLADTPWYIIASIVAVSIIATYFLVKRIK